MLSFGEFVRDCQSCLDFQKKNQIFDSMYIALIICFNKFITNLHYFFIPPGAGFGLTSSKFSKILKYINKVIWDLYALFSSSSSSLSSSLSFSSLLLPSSFSSFFWDRVWLCNLLWNSFGDHDDLKFTETQLPLPPSFWDLRCTHPDLLFLVFLM